MKIRFFIFLFYVLYMNCDNIVRSANYRLKRQQQQPNKSNLTINEINVILEVFSRCTCVLYYLCDNDGFIINDGKGLIDVRIGDENATKRLLCEGGKFPGEYICCKQRNSSELTTTTTTSTTSTSSTTTSTTTTTTTPQTIETPPPNTLKPVKRVCGNQLPVINVRILNDENQLIPVDGEFPWMAAIFKNSNGNVWKFRSAGSLIHPSVILTANHYYTSMKAKDLKVIVNGNIELSTIGQNETFERNVKEIIKHPDYNSGSVHNDVALLILNEAYNLTNRLVHINTICLKPEIPNEINQRCLTVGWGQTSLTNRKTSNILKKTELPIVEHSKCEEMLQQTRLGHEFRLHESHLCAGGEENKDACIGDGGSPLMCPTNQSNTYYQVGIVSWGIDCGRKNIPGIYSNLKYLHEWIVSELTKRNIFINN